MINASFLQILPNRWDGFVPHFWYIPFQWTTWFHSFHPTEHKNKFRSIPPYSGTEHTLKYTHRIRLLGRMHLLSEESTSRKFDTDPWRGLKLRVAALAGIEYCTLSSLIKWQKSHVRRQRCDRRSLELCRKYLWHMAPMLLFLWRNGLSRNTPI
jgi:hypothetical protein